jgi:hypothetical protein
MLFFAAGAGAVFTPFLMICMEACTLQKGCEQGEHFLATHI